MINMIQYLEQNPTLVTLLKEKKSFSHWCNSIRTKGNFGFV